MDQQTLVFDISSDEEFAFEKSSPTDNFDWITKLLEDVPEVPPDFNLQENPNFDAIDLKNGGNDKIIQEDDDGDDDVVVVGEVIVKPKRAKRSFNYDDDDDDCVVLECDPDKPPPSTVEADGVKNCDDVDSDDLIIVGEKGQVACRDFPHSRHLCANFPFSSTRHETCCSLCHCYVCDSLAPCAYWGSGASNTDHCHATDKGGYWQIERSKIRQLKNPPLQTPKPVVSLAQSPKLVQASPRPCLLPRVASTRGVSSSFGVPNIISQGRSHRPSVAVARNHYQPHLVSRQLLRPCNSNTQGTRFAQLSGSVNSSRPIFKRPGSAIRYGVAHQAAYRSPHNVTAALPQSLNQPLVVTPIESSSANFRETSPRVVLDLRSNQSNRRTLLSRPNGYGLSSPHTPTSTSQGCGPAPVMNGSQHTYSSVHQAQTHSRPVIPCYTNSALNRNSESIQQHSSATQNISGADFACPGFDTLNNIMQSNQQVSGVAQNSSSNPCDIFNVSNSVAQSCHVYPVQNSIVQGGVPTSDSLPSAENSQTTLDFDVDSWLEDNVPDDSFSDMINQPSMTAPIDTGMLCFDFETSWQGLAHS